MFHLRFKMYLYVLFDLTLCTQCCPLLCINIYLFLIFCRNEEQGGIVSFLDDMLARIVKLGAEKKTNSSVACGGTMGNRREF
mmetsp:Transcript_25940/g.38012  ORF Transcript_25940/g.38012 Transcript_25940/m.38012 type:complete len:82 (-) Transcript_25940:607-852(-)